MRGGFQGGRGGFGGGRGGFGGGFGGRGGYGGGAGGYAGGHQGGYGGPPQDTPAAAPNSFTDFAASGGERGPVIFVRNVSFRDPASDNKLILSSYPGLLATKTLSSCSLRSAKSNEPKSSTSLTDDRVELVWLNSVPRMMPRPLLPSSLAMSTAVDRLVFPTSSTRTRMEETPWRLIAA